MLPAGQRSAVRVCVGAKVVALIAASRVWALSGSQTQKQLVIDRNFYILPLFFHFIFAFAAPCSSVMHIPNWSGRSITAWSSGHRNLCRNAICCRIQLLRPIISWRRHKMRSSICACCMWVKLVTHTQTFAHTHTARLLPVLRLSIVSIDGPKRSAHCPYQI